MSLREMDKLLVVDDDDVAREATCRVLSRAGYDVDQAGDGIEALQRMEQYPYRIVVSDFDMPRMSGLQLLSIVRLVWRDTAVVIISGMPGVEQAARMRGASGYLPKPYDREELLRVIGDLTCDAEVPDATVRPADF